MEEIVFWSLYVKCHVKLGQGCSLKLLFFVPFVNPVVYLPSTLETGTRQTEDTKHRKGLVDPLACFIPGCRVVDSPMDPWQSRITCGCPQKLPAPESNLLISS